MSEKRLSDKELQLLDTDKLKKLLENQKKLLADKEVINALPDKGEKVKRRIGQLELILKLRGSDLVSKDDDISYVKDGKQELQLERDRNAVEIQQSNSKEEISHIIQFNESFIIPFLEEFEKKLEIIENNLLEKQQTQPTEMNGKKHEEQSNSNLKKNIDSKEHPKNNNNQTISTTSKQQQQQSNVLATTVVEEFFPVKTMSELINESKAENNNIVVNSTQSNSFLRRKPTNEGTKNESSSIFAKRNLEQQQQQQQQRSFKLGSRAENKQSKLILLDPKQLPPTTEN